MEPAPKTASPVETPLGRPADPALAGRTLVVEMHDSMRFLPARLTVRQGERVKLVVHNRGRLLHELVLGSREALEAHADLMRRFPDMEHDAPNMLHVAPGQSGVMGWQFTRAGEFEFACLLPGHFEAGMRGSVQVLPAR